MDISEVERQAMARGHTVRKTRFDHKDNWRLYLHQFEMVTIANDWTPYKATRHLMNTLARDAIQILSYLPLDPSYDEVKTLLYRRFPNPDEYTDCVTMFESATKRPSEAAHCQASAVRVTDLAEKAYLTLDWKVKDDMILRR